MKPGRSILLIFFLIGCAAGIGMTQVKPQTQPEDLFAQANAKYQAGEFRSAFVLYKKMVTDGLATPVVYYNLGNASFKIGKKGEALLYYRRAQRVVPRDRDLLWNLAVLKGALTDRFAQVDENLALYGIRKGMEFISIDELAMGLSVCLGILVLCLIVTFLWPVLRPWTRGLTGVCWLLVFIFGVAFFLKWTQLKEPSVVVLDPQVVARYGPSQKETKAFALHEGAEAKVLDEVKDWYYVCLEDKNVGWIPKASCYLV